MGLSNFFKVCFPLNVFAFKVATFPRLFLMSRRLCSFMQQSQDVIKCKSQKDICIQQCCNIVQSF